MTHKFKFHKEEYYKNSALSKGDGNYFALSLVIDIDETVMQTILGKSKNESLKAVLKKRYEERGRLCNMVNARAPVTKQKLSIQFKELKEWAASKGYHNIADDELESIELTYA